MSESAPHVAPIAGALGAEVSGVDLSKPLTPGLEKEIHEAWMQHQVLFFRDQDITLDQHKDFARSFGELHIHPVIQQLKDQGHPEVVVLESHENAQFVAERWHSDVTFQRVPPLGSILRAVEVPAAGGDTMWSSMYAAYDDASPSRATPRSSPLQRVEECGEHCEGSGGADDAHVHAVEGVAEAHLGIGVGHADRAAGARVAEGPRVG